jgi:acyl carrier protein
MNNIEKIIEIIKEELDSELDPAVEITSDMDLAADLHIDSLDKVLIVGDIEKEFGIVFSNDDLSNVRTIDDISEKIDEIKGREANA